MRRIKERGIEVSRNKGCGLLTVAERSMRFDFGPSYPVGTFVQGL